jgi:hypothetical protein
VLPHFCGADFIKLLSAITRLDEVLQQPVLSSAVQLTSTLISTERMSGTSGVPEISSRDSQAASGTILPA